VVSTSIVSHRRTGLSLINDEFDPRPLRRKEAVPIMTLAEMFGME
jgi:hypothetical protein